MGRVAIIGTVGIPAKYGGFETLTEYLTKELGEDYNFTVFSSSKVYKEKISKYNNAVIKYIPLNANGFQSIPYDIVSIFRAIRFAEVLLILGVSGAIVLPFIKPFFKGKIIVNIDGLEWRRDKWNNLVKWFLKFSEKTAVKFSDTVVSDNKVIQDYVKSEYSKDSNLISYGADHSVKQSISNLKLVDYPFISGPYAFKVCRIEPENNIHIILKAFKDIQNMPLVIIGNWKNSAYGKELKERFYDYNNLYLLDPIYDQERLNALRGNCTLYVHGHSAGGTNPSLVEAMYLGLPVVCYGVNYNRATTNNKAIYFENDNDLKGVVEGFTENQLEEVGKAMKEIAENEYTWSIISKKYAELF
ncbi:Glycosyltransferase involved in cell wall bisynthesis [Zhouia amylolytica]|uniref:Glycosyltransferase involved in cell wall bisynthesis n=1 Tax=Zhouia amylolytica TaxID=376730 RepID=A0A1I6QS08_9FLAO|nr:DUF1972 domain-containing protein [Zhouia amylolytica]SFS55276.1 Glycosyltransferase involved in cell wall bisynthesis [Zhouia amylolytica]